jgi:acetyl esterase
MRAPFFVEPFAVEIAAQEERFGETGLMLDADTRMVLDLIDQAVKAGRPQLHTLPAAEGRKLSDQMSALNEADPPEVAGVEDGTLPGPAGPIPYRRYKPLGVVEQVLPTLIYYHGGGFVIGNLDTHDSTCRRIANKSRCQVIAIDYRLAPEHRFPASWDDGVAAFRHIRDNAAKFSTVADKLAVGGDSAGGNLAAVVCQQVALAGEAGPSFQMLIYPVVDHKNDAPSRARNAQGYLLTKTLTDWFHLQYAPPGSVDAADPRLSPLLQPVELFAKLPPAYVLTAGYDPLCDEGKAYAEKLAAAGVRTTWAHYPSTIHAFFALTRYIRLGLVANDEAAGALAAHFGR